MRCFGIGVVLMALVACQRPSAPLDVQTYVWQHEWTPALDRAVADSADLFSTYRVLAAESTRSGKLIDAHVDLSALAASRRSVVVVYRLNGDDPIPAGDALVARVEITLKTWRDANVDVIGFEIDHDCATSKLAAYSQLLAAIRARLPHDVSLSITALPTWLGSPDLDGVLRSVDESVLQVHAVSDPATGLFEASNARRWIDTFGNRSEKPFHVALPAYGSRVSFDDAGIATGVQNEMPRDLAGADVRELHVSPLTVQSLLRDIKKNHPASMRGVVFFRLPTADDRRAWSLPTLRAVITQQPLLPTLSARTEPGADGANDIVVANSGSIDASLHAVLLRGHRCSAADAVTGYRAEILIDGGRFVPTGDVMLVANHERHIGWVRCDDIDGVSIEEHP